jgi:hypothetical protein
MKALTITIAVVAVDGTGVVAVTAVTRAGISVAVTRDHWGSIAVECRVTVTRY